MESCLIEYMIHRFVWSKEAKSQEARQKRKKRNGGRPSILVIASAECFVVASHIGINCAVSNEFVHLTLLLLLCRFPVVLLHCSVLPVQKPNSVWSLWTLCNYDGRRVRPVAETEKVSLVNRFSPRASSPTSRTCIDFFGGHNSCEFAQLFCLHVFVVALRSSG